MAVAESLYHAVDQEGQAVDFLRMARREKGRGDCHDRNESMNAFKERLLHRLGLPSWRAKWEHSLLRHPCLFRFLILIPAELWAVLILVLLVVLSIL